MEGNRQIRAGRYIKQPDRQEYDDRLQAVRDNGDWEGWLAFFLRGVGDVSGQVTDTARRMIDQGILKEFTGLKRNRRFIYQDYIRLFHDEPEGR